METAGKIELRVDSVALEYAMMTIQTLDFVQQLGDFNQVIKKMAWRNYNLIRQWLISSIRKLQYKALEKSCPLLPRIKRPIEFVSQ